MDLQELYKELQGEVTVFTQIKLTQAVNLYSKEIVIGTFELITEINKLNKLLEDLC